MKDEFFKKGDYHIVLVDWSKAASAFYPLASGYTKCIGNYLGRFLQDLNKNGVAYENMHLIGHSLGAHIAGFAGNVNTLSSVCNVGQKAASSSASVEIHKDLDVSKLDVFCFFSAR